MTNKFVMVPPTVPVKPEKPKEYFDYIEIVPFPNSEELTIDDMSKLLPKGYTLNDLRFKREIVLDSWYVSVFVYRKKKINEYKKLLQKYNKSLAKFYIEVEQFKLDIEEYITWANKNNHPYSKYYYDMIKEKLEIK